MTDRFISKIFLIHNDYVRTELNVETIAQKLNLTDKNITNLIATIEGSALKPLKDQGLIDSYEKEEGLSGLKFIIKRSRKAKINED